MEYRQTPQTTVPADGIHVVAAGETVYRVARRYRVPIPELVALNDLAPPYRLLPGQRLALPAPRHHIVAAGETVYGISRRYRSDVRTLVLANDIAPPYTIQIGQRLRLPAKRPTKIAAAAQSAIDGKPATAPRPESKPSASRARPAIRPAAKPKRKAARLPKPPPRTASRFAWPIKGRVLSRFGPKRNGLHNDGINISAARGTPVRAAESGVVVYVGTELRGFGNLLLLRHAGGWMTAYAHVDKVAVRAGQTVRRGQVVARVGSSGGVDRPQLHFEIRKGRSAVNPTRYLGRAA
ncbi:MAG: M23 family metallopeptidase [Alphaproteobacteria bacterium]|nr:M23 family metallopeptidase [Alphaproteobacteria bacterium]